MISGDYISREAAFMAAKEGADEWAGSQNLVRDTCICDAISAAVPADVRPVVRGHWVWNPNGMDWGIGAWCCDQCRVNAEAWWANDRRNNPLRCSGGRFCGNCGADMRPEGVDV